MRGRHRSGLRRRRGRPAPDRRARNNAQRQENDDKRREPAVLGLGWRRSDATEDALSFGSVTGLHVHHHLPEAVERPEVIRNLAHLWWRFHPVIYGLVAPSRQNNQYCRKPTQADATMFDHVRTYPNLTAKLARCDRYMGLNLTNLTNRDRMTVEFRVHGGSTDWTKIGAWILATQRWVEHAVARSCHYRPEPVPNTQAGLNALLIATGLKPNSRIYKRIDKPLRQAGRFLLRRWQHFNRPPEPKAKGEAA